jgi:hypothetical protein
VAAGGHAAAALRCMRASELEISVNARGELCWAVVPRRLLTGRHHGIGCEARLSRRVTSGTRLACLARSMSAGSLAWHASGSIRRLAEHPPSLCSDRLLPVQPARGSQCSSAEVAQAGSAGLQQWRTRISIAGTYNRLAELKGSGECRPGCAPLSLQTCAGLLWLVTACAACLLLCRRSDRPLVRLRV